MATVMVPPIEELEEYQKKYPAIKPAETIAMLRVMKAAELIENSISMPLMNRFDISPGKMAVMMPLFTAEKPLAPSILAERAGVTRATVSRMLQRMVRDGLAEETAGTRDRRTKGFQLTRDGRELMEKLLPDHYLRITRTMGRLNQEEQAELIRLLEKLEE